jgi:phosphoribosyl 1,2-cyclic phosphate phosphodiesterase
MRLTVLGSGTSHGIPVVGCSCAVCRSKDPKDKRMRCSLYIEGPSGETAIIDTGPEFRLQAIQAGLKKLDAVFLTHAHADHLHGLDDVRPLSHEKPLPVYCNRPTLAELRERFSYVFKTTQRGGGKPNIAPEEVTAPVNLGSLHFTPIPVKHGVLDILGWGISETGNNDVEFTEQTPSKRVFGPLAVYLTDTSSVPQSSLPLIGSPEALIIGALRERPHETHFNFEQSLAFAAQIGAKQVFLTHLCHDFSHQQIEKYCQTFKKTRNLQGISMNPAWDGMKLTL